MKIFPFVATLSTACSLLLLSSPARAASQNPSFLQQGSVGWSVSVLQQELQDLGYNPGPSRGYFNAQTTFALEEFQSQAHLQADGILGPLTHRALIRALKRHYDDIQAPLGQTDLTYGDYGPGVVTLQGDLSQLGYNPGPADGVFNRQTGQAVMAFQSHEGLVVDEIVGPKTYQALCHALGYSSGSNASGSVAPAPVPSPSSQVSSSPWVLGYYTQYTQASTSSQNSLAQHLHTISAIAPLWYTYRANGELIKHGYHRAWVRAYAREHHIALYPVVTNAYGNDRILTNQTLRQQIVNQLAEMAREDGYQGYNIDFEGLNYWDEGPLTAFVKALSEKLTPLGKTVTIAVIPRTAQDPYNRAYNYQALAPYVSKIVLMTYDYHDIGSAPGPVAPINWVNQAIQYAITRVNPEKIVLGLAVYGYNWASNGQTVEIHANQARSLAAQYGVPIKWNPLSDEPEFTYQSQGMTHTVYFENGYSDAFKLQLVKQYHLGGVAIWRLGDEDPHLWTVLSRMGFSH